MNIEQGIISKINSKEDYLTILNERINKDFFEEHGEVFQAIASHHSKYKTVPEKETLQKAFPNFQFYEGEEPLQFFIDKIKAQYKKKLYTTALPKVAELLPVDIDAAERELQKLVTKSKAAIKTGNTLDFSNSAEHFKSLYSKRASGLGVDGYSTSWPFLDRLTCGYHGGELIIWMGKAKMGKSWLETWQMYHIWLVERANSLYITKEMGNDAIAMRMLAIDLGFSFDSIRMGQLEADQQRRYNNRVDEIQEKMQSGEYARLGIHGFDLLDGTSGVSAIIPKVEEYLADGGILFVDGMYLIPDDRGEVDWRGIVNVATDLKILAQTYDIPVVVTTQQSMEDKSDIPRLENAAYGKYIVQYADLILAIGRSDIDRKADLGHVYVLGQREGDIGEFTINMKFNPIDFSQCNEKIVDDYDEDDDEDVYHV